MPPPLSELAQCPAIESRIWSLGEKINSSQLISRPVALGRRRPQIRLGHLHACDNGSITGSHCRPRLVGLRRLDPGALPRPGRGPSRAHLCRRDQVVHLAREEFYLPPDLRGCQHVGMVPAQRRRHQWGRGHDLGPSLRRSCRGPDGHSGTVPLVFPVGLLL